MLLAAIWDNNPVVFLEHKRLYGGKGGRKGKTSVDPVLEAAAILEREGISAEVIDVCRLVPLDIETLDASARKTSHVLIVEEDNLTGGWGAEVAARLGDSVFNYLDAPITRLAAPDTPVPCAPSLEYANLPGVE